MSTTAPSGVRLVATDMDGTLLRDDQTVSPRTHEAVRAARHAGITVVAATGRGWRSAAPLLDQLPEITHAVCSNGALIRDLHVGCTTDAFPIEMSTLEALIDVLDATVPATGLAWELTDGVTATYSGVGMVEITGDGVHKAASLAVLCDRLGIDRTEVLALGDNRNDVEMLVWAGRGVAMGNARPEAVAAADEQTVQHMDDGVAVVLEQLLAAVSLG